MPTNLRAPKIFFGFGLFQLGSLVARVHVARSTPGQIDNADSAIAVKTTQSVVAILWLSDHRTTRPDHIQPTQDYWFEVSVRAYPINASLSSGGLLSDSAKLYSGRC